MSPPLPPCSSVCGSRGIRWPPAPLLDIPGTHPSHRSPQRYGAILSIARPRTALLQFAVLFGGGGTSSIMFSDRFHAPSYEAGLRAQMAVAGTILADDGDSVVDSTSWI